MQELPLRVNPYRPTIRTRFIVWHVKQRADIERCIRFVVQVVARLVECIGDESIELLVLLLRYVFGFHRPQSLKTNI